MKISSIDLREIYGEYSYELGCLCSVVSALLIKMQKERNVFAFRDQFLGVVQLYFDALV